MSRISDPWKLLPLLQEATGFLRSKGLESARLEAEIMLAAALGVRRLDLYLQFDKVLSGEQVEAFRAFVRDRLTGRPVQYVTGDAAFRLLDLRVDERVLVPRPETEILVEAVLAFLVGGPAGPVLDVGSGSGAVALALAHESAPRPVVASDVSPAALAVARANAERCGLAGRVRFLCGDLLAALADGARFAAIASNPPYVASGDLPGLQAEVRDHEPRLALDGGADGLEVIRRLVAAAGDHLLPGGRLFLEVGAGQAADVAALLTAAGLDGVEVRPDLAGIARVVSGGRPGAGPPGG